MISNERAADELGWRASTPLREGVRRYLAWLAPERAPAQEREPVAEPVVVPAAAVAPMRRVDFGLAQHSGLDLAQRLDRGPRLRRRDPDPLSPRLQVRRLRHRAGRLRSDHLRHRDPAIRKRAKHVQKEEFPCKITVQNLAGTRPAANAKSPLAILTLAVQQGHQILIDAEGEKADEALLSLKQLIDSDFGEGAGHP